MRHAGRYPVKKRRVAILLGTLAFLWAQAFVQISVNDSYVALWLVVGVSAYAAVMHIASKYSVTARRMWVPEQAQYDRWQQRAERLASIPVLGWIWRKERPWAVTEHEESDEEAEKMERPR